MTRYNSEAVNAAIDSSNRAGRRIGGREARMIHAVLMGRTARPRFTVERQGSGATYVADNAERCLAHGPHRTEAESAYECDRMRRPTYHDGSARPAWADLSPAVQGTWHRNPTAR